MAGTFRALAAVTVSRPPTHTRTYKTYHVDLSIVVEHEEQLLAHAVGALEPEAVALVTWLKLKQKSNYFSMYLIRMYIKMAYSLLNPFLRIKQSSTVINIQSLCSLSTIISYQLYDSKNIICFV
jgi:hypothetical protein